MVNNTMIGALRVEATLESGKFVDGAKKIKVAANDAERGARKSFAAIEQSAAGAGKGFGLLGAALKGLAAGLSISLFVNLAQKGLEYAKSLGEVAAQAGTTTRDLQLLRYAAGQLGVSQSELDGGLSKLTVTLGKVAAGAAAPTKALQAIGISAKQIQGVDTGTAFRMISDGLSKVTDRAERAAVEVALFGESGSKLDSMLSGGSQRINELARAADELGIVLSQEEIAKADETANKLEAVKRVLAAKIAGVVVQNADAIMALADSLAYLITQAGVAAAKMTAFYRSMAINAARWSAAHPQLSQVAFGKKGTAAILSAGAGAIRSNIADKRAPNIETNPGRSAATIPDFLAPKGGGGRRSRAGRAARDTSARDAFEFANDLRRADMDLLRAKQSLAHDYVEQTALSIEMLNLEKEGYKAELEYKVNAKELTKAQADQLLAKYELVDTAKRQAVLEEEELKRQEDYNALDDKDFEIQRDIMAKRASLAETAGERRQLELELLKLEYDHKRMVLERIMAESRDWREQEEARSDLANLDRNYSLDRQGVMNSTRGPWDEWLASLPTTAAKADEALQRLQVEGFEGLIDAAMELQHGFDDAGKALLQTLKNFVLGIARMELQKALGGLLGGGGAPLSGLIGGVSGIFSGGMSASSAGTGALDFATPGMGSLAAFASGGSFNILGNRGVDRNILSLNGLPIARVSHGERLSVSNEGMNGGRSLVQNFSFPNSDFDSFRRSQPQAARLARRTMGRI